MRQMPVFHDASPGSFLKGGVCLEVRASRQVPTFV